MVGRPLLDSIKKTKFATKRKHAHNMGKVAIEGLPSVELLCALWNASTPSKWHAHVTFDERAAVLAVTEAVDMFCGRAICVDFRKCVVDDSDYDRYAGEGTFKTVVDALRAKHATKKVIKPIAAKPKPMPVSA